MRRRTGPSASYPPRGGQAGARWWGCSPCVQGSGIGLRPIAHAASSPSDKLVNQPASEELEDRLVYVGEGRFKHGQNIDVWQYVDPAAAFVNSSVAADLAVSSHLETLMARMNLTSIMQAFDSMEWDKLHPDTASRLLGLVQQMLNLVNDRSEVRPERTEAPVTGFDVGGGPT